MDTWFRELLNPLIFTRPFLLSEYVNLIAAILTKFSESEKKAIQQHENTIKSWLDFRYGNTHYLAYPKDLEDKFLNDTFDKNVIITFDNIHKNSVIGFDDKRFTKNEFIEALDNVQIAGANQLRSVSVSEINPETNKIKKVYIAIWDKRPQWIIDSVS